MIGAQPEDRFAQLELPVALDPGDAEHFGVVHGEGRAVDDQLASVVADLHVEVVDAQHLFGADVLLAARRVGQLGSRPSARRACADRPRSGATVATVCRRG